jgi:hypothetical protein
MKEPAVRRHHLQVKKKAFSRTWLCGYRDLGFSASGIVINMLLLKPPSLRCSVTAAHTDQGRWVHVSATLELVTTSSSNTFLVFQKLGVPMGSVFLKALSSAESHPEITWACGNRALRSRSFFFVEWPRTEVQISLCRRQPDQSLMELEEGLTFLPGLTDMIAGWAPVSVQSWILP